MPSSTNPHTYTAEELELLFQAAFKLITVRFDTRADATAARHRIYGLRKALWNTFVQKTDPLVFHKRELIENLPHPIFGNIPAAQQIQTRLEGNTLLVGAWLPQSSRISAIQRALAETGMPTFATEQANKITAELTGVPQVVTTPATPQMQLEDDNDPASSAIRKYLKRDKE